MAKFRFVLREVHQVHVDRYEDFDTADQQHWLEIIQRINAVNGSKEDDYPTIAPDDPKVWFDTFTQMEPTELREREEDYWISVSKNTYETYIKLFDEDGNVVIDFEK